MAAHGRRNLECRERLRTAGAASHLCFRLADRTDLNVPHQPFRSVWVAPGLALSERSAVHATEVPYSRITLNPLF